MGCPTLSQSLCLSLEELPRPTGGPITGLSSLQFIMRMAYVTLAVRKELRLTVVASPACVVCCYSKAQLGQVATLVERPACE